MEAAGLFVPVDSAGSPSPDGGDAMTISEAIQELRKRNQPVPKPARLPTSEEVDEAEGRLEAKFHADYRRFLLEASDVVYGTQEPAQVTTSGGWPPRLVEMLEDARAYPGFPPDLLPFCDNNADYFCMHASGESPEVLYWSHDGLTDEKWPNLATWIMEVWIGEQEAFEASQAASADLSEAEAPQRPEAQRRPWWRFWGSH